MEKIEIEKRRSNQIVESKTRGTTDTESRSLRGSRAERRTETTDAKSKSLREP
jgi:hypothetical protein